MPQFEEGDDIVYQNPIYGQGKGVIMAWNEEKGMYMILPKKKIGAQYIFCHPSELIATPF